MDRGRDHSAGSASLFALLSSLVILGILAAIVYGRLAPSSPAPKAGGTPTPGVLDTRISRNDLSPAAACEAEHVTLATAEETYGAVNGVYGSEEALVSGGYLHPASAASPTVYWRVQSPAPGTTGPAYALAKVDPQCPDQ